MKFGLTQQFACSYLEDQKEQLLVFVDEQGPKIHHLRNAHQLWIQAQW